MRKVGRVTIRVDLSQAFPGGVVVVRLGGARLGSAWALLDGRRAPFYPDRGVPRALVPVAASAEAGPATLGVGLAARGGEQRIVVPVQIAARSYARAAACSSASPGRALLARREVAARRAAAARLRAHGVARARARPRSRRRSPPAGRGFGELRTYTGAGEAESRIDALGGERHRGLDYPVPTGTAGARARPRARALRGPARALGRDRGRSTTDRASISVLQHLSRIDVQAGDTRQGRRRARCLSGDTRPRPRAAAAVARLPARGRGRPAGARPAARLTCSAGLRRSALRHARDDVRLGVDGRRPAARQNDDSSERAATRASASRGAGQTPRTSVTAGRDGERERGGRRDRRPRGPRRRARACTSRRPRRR